MAIVLLLMSGFSLATWYIAESPEAKTKAACRKSEDLRNWLTASIHSAILCQRGFQLKAYAPFSDHIYIRWTDTNKKEYFMTDEQVWIATHNEVSLTSTFSPQWQTMSPGFTLDLAVAPDKGDIVKYLIVSLKGRVRIGDTPP